jgi:hypothetical protein
MLTLPIDHHSIRNYDAGLIETFTIAVWKLTCMDNFGTGIPMANNESPNITANNKYIP